VRHHKGKFIEDQYIHYAEIIFNHDFAKALWGTDLTNVEGYQQAAWAHHLQEMVIADDSIKYLREDHIVP